MPRVDWYVSGPLPASCRCWPNKWPMVLAAPIVYVLAGPNGAGKTSLYWYEASEVPRLNGDALYQQGHETYTVEAELRRQLDAWVA